MPDNKITFDQAELDIYQYCGRAKDMPKRMREHFKEKGIIFSPSEWVNINEFVHYSYSLENRWTDE